MKRTFPVLILLLALLPLSACAPAAQATVKVRLPVGYIPDIQFAPLYEAIDKGYYKAEGLDVSLDYSMESDNVALVGANTLQFAMVSGEQVLLGRSKNLPIVYVMDWYHQYPVGISAPVSAGIQKPADLKGKHIGIPGLYGASYIGARAILSAGGLQEKDVTLDAIGFTQVEALSAGREDAIVVYIANEPVQLEAQGKPVSTLKVSDYLPLVGNGLITNELTLKNNPDLVRKMVRATLKGIQDAIANPDEAYTLSKKYVENLSKADPAVQKKVLSESIQLWQGPAAAKPGASDLASWQNMQKVLLDMKLIPEALDLSKAYSNDYLP